MISSPLNTLSPQTAIPLLHAGGLIAYPTEAVWGLGCDPNNQQAVLRLLSIKQRPVEKGLILVAADIAQLDDWACLGALPGARRQAVLETWPGAHTWILPASEHAPHWITGSHPGIAVRISAHPVVQALCCAFAGPLVSTSANLAGQPPVHQCDQLNPQLVAQLDGIVFGETGGLEHATSIRNASSGQQLR